ncbi:MAG: GAF domain-containing protein [Pseudonocardiaceae bacterium]
MVGPGSTWQSAAMHVGTLLLSGEDPHALSLTLVEHALRLGDVAGAAITAVGADPVLLRVVVGIGVLHPGPVGELVLRRGSISQLTRTTGTVIVVDDLVTDPRMSSSAARIPGIGPAIAAPLGDDMVLLVARATGTSPFCGSDVEVIASFAGQVGRALTLADARRQRERRRLIEDRELIATQLNEQAMQALLGISTTVHGLTARMQSPDDAQRLADQADRLDAVLRQMQRAIFGLHLHPAD